MKIVKYKKEKSGKYKVYLEDGSTLTTYEDVIINNNLLYHNQIDDNLKEKLENESNYQKIYNTCIKYISVRVRSTKEVKDYLYKKNIDEETIISIIERLKNNKLLNDEVFTELFIKDKLNLTNDGEYKIINSLKEHGISSSIIDKYTYLFDRDLLYKKIDKVIQKNIKADHKHSGLALKNKIYTNLMNLGYDKDMIMTKLNEYNF